MWRGLNTESQLREYRTVTIEKGRLTDYFEPFEVHIYELGI